MLAHIRHWIAKQFEPGRRAGTASTLVVWACVAFFLASNLIWPVRLKDWSPEYHRVQKLFDEANAARDPAEGQRLLAEANAENARVQTAATQNIAEDGQMIAARGRASNCAMVIMLAAMIPGYVAMFRKKRRDGWLKSGRCGNCGYDLRASPGRCPECGSEAAGVR